MTIGPCVVAIPQPLLANWEPCQTEAQQLAQDLQEIFRNSFDGIFVADGAGRTLMVNAGCERNYDLPADEMIGRHVSEFEAPGHDPSSHRNAGDRYGQAASPPFSGLTRARPSWSRASRCSTMPARYGAW